MQLCTGHGGCSLPKLNAFTTTFRTAVTQGFCRRVQNCSANIGAGNDVANASTLLVAFFVIVATGYNSERRSLRQIEANV